MAPMAGRTYGPGAEPQGGAAAAAAPAAAPDGPSDNGSNVEQAGPPAQPVEAELLLDPLDPGSPLQACPSPSPAPPRPQLRALPFRLWELLSTEGVYSRDMGRGNSREGGGRWPCQQWLQLFRAGPAKNERHPAAWLSAGGCGPLRARTCRRATTRPTSLPSDY